MNKQKVASRFFTARSASEGGNYEEKALKIKMKKPKQTVQTTNKE